MNHLINATLCVLTLAWAVPAQAGAKIEGTWRITRLAAKGKMAALPSSVKVMTFQFAKDGKFYMSMTAVKEGKTFTRTSGGTYQVKGARLEITLAKAKKEAHVFKIKGGRMTLFVKKKPIMVLERVKKVKVYKVPAIGITAKTREGPQGKMLIPRATVKYTPPNHEQQILRWILNNMGNK